MTRTAAAHDTDATAGKSHGSRGSSPSKASRSLPFWAARSFLPTISRNPPSRNPSFKKCCHRLNRWLSLDPYVTLRMDPFHSHFGSHLEHMPDSVRHGAFLGSHALPRCSLIWIACHTPAGMVSSERWACQSTCCYCPLFSRLVARKNEGLKDSRSAKVSHTCLLAPRPLRANSMPISALILIEFHIALPFPSRKRRNTGPSITLLSLSLVSQGAHEQQTLGPADPVVVCVRVECVVINARLGCPIGPRRGRRGPIDHVFPFPFYLSRVEGARDESAPTRPEEVRSAASRPPPVADRRAGFALEMPGRGSPRLWGPVKARVLHVHFSPFCPSRCDPGSTRRDDRVARRRHGYPTAKQCDIDSINAI